MSIFIFEANKLQNLCYVICVQEQTNPNKRMEQVSITSCDAMNKLDHNESKMFKQTYFTKGLSGKTVSNNLQEGDMQKQQRKQQEKQNKKDTSSKLETKSNFFFLPRICIG